MVLHGKHTVKNGHPF